MKDPELPQESVAVDSSIQESSSELDLLKKLQVLQTMNPAFKALINYRGTYTNKIHTVSIRLHNSSFMKCN